MNWLKIVILLTFSSPMAALDLSQYEKDGNLEKSDGESLGLQIMGTITNDKSKPESNVALIKENGKIRAVKKNMVVLSDYRVDVVQNKFIIIKNKLTRHLIFQNKFANEFKTTPKVKKRDALVYREEGFERSESKIKMTGAYRDKLVNNDLSKILMQATAIPHYQGPEMVGFKILQIDRGSIYDKSGFIDHDVITAINGNKLNSASGAIKLLKSLKGANAISVEYLRYGEPRTMDINID